MFIKRISRDAVAAAASRLSCAAYVPADSFPAVANDEESATFMTRRDTSKEAFGSAARIRCHLSVQQTRIPTVATIVVKLLLTGSLDMTVLSLVVC